ncbi:H-NS histone family protein [Trinickia mobilis]|uniref:H-NS histone family protein n=1 Tax=Trinickia mobilis TaxID=2816356 RepID=UPI001A8FDC0C|nr:H-NS histone family protein [Trinickia mobilis]
MATLQQIQAKLQKLRAQADALVAKKSSAVVEKIRELMAQHGLTTADINAHTGVATSGAKRGPKPGFKRAGKSAAAAAAKKTAASQAKGKLPPKYRDPKSGATWSGRGPAPAWLASAKDRSKFLIDGASAAADSKPTVTKAVAKKAPTVKKTAAKKAVSAKVPAKKAPRKRVAVPASVATVESGAELTN